LYYAKVQAALTGHQQYPGHLHSTPVARAGWNCLISFELAATVFIDRLALSIHDMEHSENEERWVTLGQADNGQLLVVAHTYQETR